MDFELCNIAAASLPKSFDENNFWIRKREMQLYLSYLKLVRYLCEEKLVNHVSNTDVVILASEEAWIHGDYMCKRMTLG